MYSKFLAVLLLVCGFTTAMALENPNLPQHQALYHGKYKSNPKLSCDNVLASVSGATFRVVTDEADEIVMEFFTEDERTIRIFENGEPWGPNGGELHVLGCNSRNIVRLHNPRGVTLTLIFKPGNTDSFDIKTDRGNVIEGLTRDVTR